MSEAITGAVAALNDRIGGGFAGAAKFVIAGEGAILVGPGGVRAANDDAGADVTLTADLATFRAIFEGALSPTAAFMTGRLKVEGDMATALRLAGALA